MKRMFGVLLTGVFLGLLVQSSAQAQDEFPLPKSYASFPKSAGLRVLIDFSKYNTILGKAKGYVLQRFNDPTNTLGGDAAALETIKLQQGKESGMAVQGYANDPDGHPDIRKTRSMTELGAMFKETDPLREWQKRMAGLRTEAEKRPGDKAFIPTPAGASGGAGTAKFVPKDDVGAIQYTPSKEDFILDNWVVELNSSARTIINREMSYTKEVKGVKLGAAGATGQPAVATDLGDAYLGVRVHFPTHKYNAYAKVRPPYELPAYDTRGLPINYSKFDEEGYDPATGTLKAGFTEDDPRLSYNGVIHNVAQIKSLIVRASGRNYPHGLAIRLRDQDGNVDEYFMGYLDFAGWRYLRWDNPNYTTTLTSDELFRIPLYPAEIPYRVLDSVVIYRNGHHTGGNFVCYVDWIKMDFDLAVAPDELKGIDVDDDSWWYIVRDRNAKRNAETLKRYADEIDLRQQIVARSRRLQAFPDMIPVESKTK